MFSWIFNWFSKFFPCKHVNRELIAGTNTLLCKDCGHVENIPCDHKWEPAQTGFQKCTKCGKTELIDIRNHTHIDEKIEMYNIYDDDIKVAVDYVVKCKICGRISHTRI